MHATEGPEPTLLDYLRVLRKRRWIIIALVLSTVLTVTIWSLRAPKIYESTATLLPPLDGYDKSGLSALLAASGVAQGLGVSLPGKITSADIFVAILKSRTVADKVIDAFDLMERYKIESQDLARARLKKNVGISSSREKVITIKVEDTDPRKAAEIANFYVTALEELTHTLNITAAKRNRLFLEKRVAETEEALAKSEEALREFQTANRTVSLETQAKAAIEAAAGLQGKITVQEVQLQVMESFLSPAHPDVIRLKLEIEELKRQLTEMEQGSHKNLHPTFIQMPALAQRLARLMRDVKIQETVYTLLMSQYEQAKIQEAIDTPTVQVLDPALPAERPSKPKIGQNILLAAVVSLFGGVALAFCAEYVQGLKEQERRNQSEGGSH